jgi:hypothetical protein
LNIEFGDKLTISVIFFEAEDHLGFRLKKKIGNYFDYNALIKEAKQFIMA